jgi:hypothetical protein
VTLEHLFAQQTDSGNDKADVAAVFEKDGNYM